MLAVSLETPADIEALEGVVGRPDDTFPAPTTRMGSPMRSLGCSPLSERPKHIVSAVGRDREMGCWCVELLSQCACQVYRFNVFDSRVC